MAQASTALIGASLHLSLFASPSRGLPSSVGCGIGSLYGAHSRAHFILPLAERIFRTATSGKLYTKRTGKSICPRRGIGLLRAGMRTVHPSATDSQQFPLLKLVSKVLAKGSEDEAKHRISKLGVTLQLFGVNAFALLQTALPAQAAKFVPPPLGTSDALPVTDEVTAADLGGLATVGLILLLVFVVGNVLLPSLMFSDGEPTSPYKRDEEGDFYHDPSVTKKFFKEARSSDEDIDEVAWSQAPFSKLAHGISKILPPPNSVGTPPEVTRVRSKGLQRPSGPVGSGVRFSGIVAAPGYGSEGSEPQVGGDQATGTVMNEPGFPVTSSGEGLSSGQEGVTTVEGNTNPKGSVGVVKGPAFEIVRKAHKLDMLATRQPRRAQRRLTGSGRSLLSRWHLGRLVSL